MNKRTNCNCFIGIVNDYDQSELNELYLDDYIEKLVEKSKLTKLINNTFQITDVKVLQSWDYIDKRRGLAKIFSFCPKCGSKIEWKKIKENLKGA